MVASVAAYFSLNRGRLMDAARPAISHAIPEPSATPADRGLMTPFQVTAPPMIATPVGSNATAVTNTVMVSAGTNSWQRVTAGRYADLIREIRSARGDAQ